MVLDKDNQLVVVTVPLVDEGPAVVASGSGRIQRRRGRPYKSLTQVLGRADVQLGLPEFAFVRATLLGVSPTAAAKRYFPTVRTFRDEDAQHYRDALIERILSLGIELTKSGELIKESVKHALDTVRVWWTEAQDFSLTPENTVPDSDSETPSFQSFLESRDWDGFSMAEVMDEYREAYGVDPVTADPKIQSVKATSSPFDQDRLSEVAEAIRILQGTFVVLPHGTDGVHIWFARTIADKLLPHGVLTLKDFVSWINIKGPRWYSHLKGIGTAKAAQILSWLGEHSETIGVKVSHVSTSVRLKLVQSQGLIGQAMARLETSAALQTVEVTGLVPLDHFAWPLDLKGQEGRFRTFEDNALRATDDESAVRNWLSQYTGHTLQLYKRALNCLVLWAVVERKTNLSSLDKLDLRDFRKFLANPPAHWIQERKVVRDSYEWRPLRSKLSQASINSLMRPISAFFTELHACNYLKSNPAAGSSKTSAEDFKIDTNRSFSNQDLEVVAQVFKELPAGVAKNRLRAIIMLLQTTGVRRSEAIGLTWGNMSRVRVANNLTDSWMITFVGKGNKQRSIPIVGETYQALKLHLEDRKGLVETKALAYLHHLTDAEWPLIGIINDAPARQREASEGDTFAHAGRDSNITGRLSQASIHRLVKSFFDACIKEAHILGRDTHNFERASIHWWRHTFAHQILAVSDKDLNVTQQLLGHQSISTTGLYTKSDMEQRLGVIQKLQVTY